MALSLTALKSEIDNDPGGLGYAPFLAAGSDNVLASMLNTVRSGSAGDGKSYTVFRNDIDPKEVVQAIASGDFVAASQLQISKLNLLFVAAPIDATLTNVRANFAGIFSSASSGTTSALAALATRNGSRAEVLFGTGTAVSASDIARAYGRN